MDRIPAWTETLQWFKSSYSGANQTECVETAGVDGGTAVRDSKDPGGTPLRFGGAAWAMFVEALVQDRMH